MFCICLILIVFISDSVFVKKKTNTETAMLSRHGSRLTMNNGRMCSKLAQSLLLANYHCGDDENGDFEQTNKVDINKVDINKVDKVI